MTTKPHQPFASSSGSADAPTRSLAADETLSPLAGPENNHRSESVEADRRPAGSPDDLDPFALLMIEMGHKARARAQRDFDLEIPVMEGGAAFIRDGASPMEFATYVRAYANAWHRSQGHDDLVLPEAIN